MKQSTVKFVLDDSIVEVDFRKLSGLKPTTTVLNYLRSLPGHKGVKEGCGEGDCGACTVVIAELDPEGKLIYKTIDSCLVFLPMIHCKQLITIENLARKERTQQVLHPVQKILVESNGTQCGYCTPGIVMSLFGLYKNHHQPSREVIEESLAGNLCRCTGYQPILAAAGEVCRNHGKDHFSDNEKKIISLLKIISSRKDTLEIITGEQQYFKPFSLNEALRLRNEHPLAIVINGSTDVALKQTKRKESLAEIIDLSGVDELRFFQEEPDRYLFGPGLPIEQVKNRTKDRLTELHTILKVFGSQQIRNLATLGGNIASASPIGDTFPLLFAYDTVITLSSSTTTRQVPIEDFILGYRQTDLRNDELITGISIPKFGPEYRFGAFKVSRRKDVDISTVCSAFRVLVKDGNISEIILAYGGMAAVTQRAKNTEKFLAGKTWSRSVIEAAMPVLAQEFTPISDARADATYRTTIAKNLLLKFFVDPQVELQHGIPKDQMHITDGIITHATGESIYVNDIPVNNQLLTGKVVYSRVAHARIKRIDISEAILTKGVYAILLARDIPGENQMGPIIHDEPCLADQEVTFIGQAIALIAAENEDTASTAEKRVVIEYEPLEAILSIESAIALNNLIAPIRKIERGDVIGTLKKSPHVLKGTVHSGAQEHWYLETQTALAIPGEGKEMQIYASSQNPSETQAIVAEVLGISKNEVEVEVKRIGGGFGGKETQGNHVAAWSALLAHATGRPVKIHLFREDDQIMTGKRHRFLSNYQVGFDDEGKILVYNVELNSDAGSSTDLSRAILERAMLHAENAYYIPDVCIVGRVWKTNLPSNTAFRGFGGPQGMAVIENAIERIARFLGKDASDIRYLNFYRKEENNITPYGEKVINNHLPRIWDQLIRTSGYHERRKDINRFNTNHEFYKKGLSITPVKFGISFTTAFLNQAGALVNIYTDGTVLVNHGGTEMGQGLHTKILQVASLELGLTPDKVKVNATNTSKVPNTSPTAASSGSDINGMAVKNAIDILKSRLVELAVEEFSSRSPENKVRNENILFEKNQVSDKENPSLIISFEELCLLAHLNRISLSATGFYKTPGLFFDREEGQGNPFYYYSFGVAVSEVMIDTLTGNHWLLRTDILHDVGNSLHPAIDQGQIEGAFIQGVGWCTTEEIKWDNQGRLLTHSPDTYKIPTISDIPKEFRVELFQGVANLETIRGSKAVGEPPFMLALSVWLAIKDAISSVGKDPAGFDFILPATGETILLLLEKLN
ncbi:MAG: xanthine dehydrogenase molybdopterin binding subunit [Bacteroidales bacterium]|jgi:xanthine dehydrogenase molybdopterin binding subunit/xanthine dehydrogenase small subunit|nr:xanthine dehydrogenase molybdopterin binding subunit [Bacteroidales bacterium]